MKPLTKKQRDTVAELINAALELDWARVAHNGSKETAWRVEEAKRKANEISLRLGMIAFDV